MASEDHPPSVRETLPLRPFLAFEDALSILELTLETLVGSRTASLTTREYAARVDLAAKVYARVSPLCASFVRLAHGLPIDDIQEAWARSHPLNFSARLLKAHSTSALPAQQQHYLGSLLERTLALGLIEHLILWHHVAREQGHRVDLDALYQRWITESRDADEMMEGINKRGVLPIEAIFAEHWRSTVRSVLKNQLAFGFWRVHRCHGYFRRLFYAGALLGMSYDLAAAESA